MFHRTFLCATSDCALLTVALKQYYMQQPPTARCTVYLFILEQVENDGGNLVTTHKSNQLTNNQTASMKYNNPPCKPPWNTAVMSSSLAGTNAGGCELSNTHNPSTNTLLTDT